MFNITWHKMSQKNYTQIKSAASNGTTARSQQKHNHKATMTTLMGAKSSFKCEFEAVITTKFW